MDSYRGIEVVLLLIIGFMNKDTVRLKKDVHVFQTSTRRFWVQEINVGECKKVEKTESLFFGWKWDSEVRKSVNSETTTIWRMVVKLLQNESPVGDRVEQERGNQGNYSIADGPTNHTPLKKRGKSG
jgi:hypothetical protein